MAAFRASKSAPGKLKYGTLKAPALTSVQRRVNPRCLAPTDRRIKVVKPTRKGKEVAERLEKAASALRVKLLGDIPEADIETATRVLHLLEERSIRYLAEEALQWVQAPGGAESGAPR
ncbi:hypothetical protein [Cupriavidus basilensis]|uniref:hypothetical protein n=1 Tax=Cupriavidus basilensis TaxID=68895 RepID=UPI000696A146|nr:hypothetical protein [Cupriavidus basilensis]